MDQINYSLTKQHFSAKIYKSYLQYLSKHYPSINLSELCLKAGLSPDYVFKSEGWVSVEFNYRFMTEIKNLISDPDFEYKVGESSFSKEIMGPIYYLMKNVLTLGDIYDNLWKLTKYFNKVVSFKAIRKKRGEVTIEAVIIEEGLTQEELDYLKASMPDIMNNSLGYYSGFSKSKDIDSTTVSAIKYSDVKYHIVVKYPIQTYAFLDGFYYPTIASGMSLLATYPLVDSLFQRLSVAIIVFISFFIYSLRKKNVDLVDAVNQSEDMLSKLDGQYKNLIETKISLQRKLVEAEAINELTNTLIQTSSEQEILQNAADKLTKILNFDRVVIMTSDDAKQFLNVRATSVQDPALVGVVQQFRLPIDIDSEDRTKVSNIFRNGTPIFIEDVRSHLATLNSESQQVLMASKSTAFIGVPIKSDSESHGVMLADTFYSNRSLSIDDVNILSVAGRQISIALEKQKAKASLERTYLEIEKLADSYSRFVPFETIKLLGFNSVREVTMSQGVELNMTVVFCDIRGFTSLSEVMSPAQTMIFLNSYFASLAPIFTRNNGIIDKFMGDGIMALFENPNDALRASSEFQIALDTYNSSQEKGAHLIRTGMGIHRGKVLLGAVGYADRLSISVVSDAVNLTSRLDGLTKKFGVDILCTEEVFEQSEFKNHFRLIAELKVEGRKGLTKVYEYFGFMSEEQINFKSGNRDLIERVVKRGAEDIELLSVTPKQLTDSVLKHYFDQQFTSKAS